MRKGTIVKINDTMILGIVIEEPLTIGGRYTIDTELHPPMEAYEGELESVPVWKLNENQLRTIVILLQKHIK